MQRDLLSGGDHARIEHILRTGRDAIAILGNSEAPDLARDMTRSRALVNCFTEIGEAARTLSDTARARVGPFPWRDIIGLRNIIVHAYWNVDFRRLVRVVRVNLPALLSAAEHALAQWPSARAEE